MSLYGARFLPHGIHPRLSVVRFDDDLNVERLYTVTAKTCSCPAGGDITCRHRKMFRRLLAIAEKGLFYDYDNRVFLDLHGEEVKVEDFK